MKTQLTHGLILATMLFGVLLLGTPTGAAQANGISPATLLNADGTLNLDGSFSGSFDLSGYSVLLDPTQGPILEPAGGKPAAAQAAGEWSSLGSGLGALNNVVNAIAVNGSDVYIGGNFTDANEIPEADYIVKWNGSAWSVLGSNGAGSNGALNGAVTAMAVSGSDIYVGGGFFDVHNNSAADYIARWDTLTGDWSAVGSNGAGGGSLNGPVYALAVSGRNVYVGGQFSNVNNNGVALAAADRIARWNIQTGSWSALGSNGAGDGSLNGLVYALAVDGTEVYVGGVFTNVNNNGATLLAADYIARWNGSNWSALGSNGAGDGSLNNTVKAVAVSGADLYVGGSFTDVNNNGTMLAAADYIAQWNGSSWSALGSDGANNGALSGPVTAIAASSSTVYVGGDFWDVSNNGVTLTVADYLAQWDGSNWGALGSSAGEGLFNDAVNAITLNGSNVYVGGYFTHASVNGAPQSAATYIALWNGSAWSAPAATNPTGALGNIVRAIAVSGTNVYVGGNFENVQNGATALPAADYVARWDAQTGNWSALGSNGAGGGSLNGAVVSLAVDGATVYVGGYFTDVNNNGAVLPTADYVARWDSQTDSWSALGNNGAGNGSLNNPVNAIAVSGSNVYVGGQFTNVNNNGTGLPAADYIARWDGSNWSSLLGDGVSNGSLNGKVNTIAVSGANVYVGGEFTNVNNGGAALTAADYIARWDALANNWSAVGSNGAGDGSLNAFVNVIAVNGSDLYVGGLFLDVNNNGAVLNAADHIARWDGSEWSALGRNGAGNGVFNGVIKTIAVNDANVYVGGYFTQVNDNGTFLPAAYLAKWDTLTGTWSALGSNGVGGSALNAPVEALAAGNTSLYVGGSFINVNNNGTVLTAADYVAAYATADSSVTTSVYLPLILR